VSDHEINDAEDDGFLKRWSARKRKTETVSVQEVDAAEIDMGIGDTELPFNAPASPQTIETGTDANLQAAEDEAPLLTDDDMPPLDSLSAESDLSDFFNAGVSATLRRAALRHVFSLPVYNIRDGLNDYDDDYTKFEPLGDTVTSDMKWHKARKEREAAEREAEEEAAKQSAAEQESVEQESVEDTESVKEPDEAVEQEEPASDAVDEPTDNNRVDEAEELELAAKETEEPTDSETV